MSGWTDTQDTNPDARGRQWCTYEVPTADETCPINNPVQPGSGVKVLSEVDVSAPGNQSLPLVRHYRSQWPEGLTDGLAPRSGWRLPWQAQLSTPKYGQTTKWAKQAVPAVIWVARPSGRVDLFHSKSGGPWQGAGSRHALIDLGASAATERWSLTDADTGHTEYYDPAGRLSRVVERTGLTTTVQRDSTGRLLSVTHSSGRQWAFAYSGSAISTATGPGGVPVHYTHSGGNLTQVRVGASTGPAWRYHYEDRTYPRALTGISDPSGQRMATYSYDYSSGKVARTEGANGQDAYSYHFTTDAQGRPMCQVTNGMSGQTDTLQFADANHARPQVGTLSNTGQGTSQSFDAQGRLQRQLTASGEVVFYTRNARGQETQRATFRAPYLAHTTPPPLSQAVSVVSTQWHATFNLPTQVAEPGKVTAYSYNAQGMLTSQSWTATADATGVASFGAVKTGRTYATDWGYNANSLNTSVVERVDGAETQRWTLAYSASGDLSGITDVTAGNKVATIVNDAHGRPVGGTTDQGVAIAVAYNARGSITSIARGGQASTFTYNPAGSLVQVRMPGNRVIDYVLDAKQSIIDMKLNGVSITPQMLAQADYPDTALKAHLALARQWLVQGVESLMKPAQAQSAAMGGLLRPVPPVFDPRNDMLMSPMGDTEKAARRLAETFARSCECKPEGGYDKPTFTLVTYAHVLFGGHLSPSFSDKSYFAPSEKIGQALVDEVLARGTVISGPNSEHVVVVADLIRPLFPAGYARTRTGFIPTNRVRVVYERNNCNSQFRARNEVVTIHPE